MNKKKTYYYDKSIEIMDSIKENSIRPILGIHVCCGVCAAFPLEFLANTFQIKILYSNSNIYPKEEYQRRFNELKRYVDIFNSENNQDVEIIEFLYENEKFNHYLSPFCDEEEGGKRCLICYEKRMDETYKFANDNNFDYFTTVMTISRQKNSKVLNEIGEKLSKKYQTKYFYSDFKKNKGIDRGRELRLKYDMYNQEYCGCIYSYQKYLKKH